MSDSNELIKIFQKNLLYFQNYYPDLYEKLSQHSTNERYELIIDKNGYFNIEILATGAKIFIDNSDLIAEQQVENCLKDNSNTKKAIFIGTLLGLQIEKLILKTRAPCIMIIEPDIELFKLSAFLIDYEALTLNRVTIFSIMDTTEILEKKILEFLFTMYYHNNNITFLTALNEYQPLLEKVQSTYSENIFYPLHSNNTKIPKKQKVVDVSSLLLNAQREQKKGNDDKAIQNYLQVIENEIYEKTDSSAKQKSNILIAYLNVGNIFFKNRLTAEAYHCYGKCVYSEVQDIMVYETALNNYVHINQTQKKAFNKMILLLENYLKETSTNTSLINKLAELYYITNQHEKAENFLKPFNELLLKNNNMVAMLPTLPVIYDSQEEIDKARDKFEKALDNLLTQDIKIKEQDLEVYSTFFFAYHNRNNKTLFSKLSKFYEKTTPSILYEAKHCKNYKYNDGKIKIGFISNHLIKGHPVLKMIQNVIDTFIKHKNYEVFVFSFSNTTKDIFPNNTYILNNSLKESRKIVSKFKLDILMYPDIGMNPTVYILAHARLAPIQCVMSGHPVTSGIQNIDYFISNKYTEADNAQEQYSETLVLFNNNPGQYTKPDSPKEFISKKSLGLKEEIHNYLIPAKLQKIHPDFDKLLFKLLEKDKKANFIFFQDNLENQWDEFIKERLLKTIPSRYITILPFAEKNKFYSLMHHADAILEPLVFGYGTTATQAFSIGAPVVTLPGKFHFGRAVNAYYTIMQFTELIASDEDDYINKAIKLATDVDYKVSCTESILELSNKIYGKKGVFDEYHAFFNEKLTT